MVCKLKGCKNQEHKGYRFCNNHLCERIKKGVGCKNKKYGDTPFCFLHRVSNSDKFIPGIIISIIITLAGIFYGPILYSHFFGSLEIDFKENDIILNEGIPSVRIELLNQLGYPLTFVNGTVNLSCANSFNKESQTFKLEGGRDFLADGSKSELLLSPDPFFVDLIKTRDNPCPEATYEFITYKRLNETHVKLEMIYLFEFFIVEKGLNITPDLKITANQYTYADNKHPDNCQICNVTIKISSSEKEFSKTEIHKFVGATNAFNYEDIIEYPIDKGTLTINRLAYIESLYKPCFGKNVSECTLFLCKQITENFNITYNCLIPE